MRFTVLTFIAYEALWFAVVIGAASRHAWVGVGLSALFIGWQVAASAERALAWRLVVVALLLGVLVDGGAHALGVVRYASAEVALPPGGAPLWIIGLWGAFGVTLVSAFRWIAGRPVLAATLGAVGGPLSYLGAQRGWGTVTFPAPAWQGMVYLGVGWAIALGVLSVVASRGSRGAMPVQRRGKRGTH